MQEEQLTQINWQYLFSAQLAYVNIHKYTYIDTPWIVSTMIKKYTFNENTDIHCLINNRSLVGSAEQGFLSNIHLLEKDKKYCSISPCFRTESEYSNMHREYFMKLELFIRTQDRNKIFDVLTDAKNVLRTFLKPDTIICTVQTDDNSFDILINDIEVGSYGYRQYSGVSWVYGTGIAEPRLSVALGV